MNKKYWIEGALGGVGFVLVIEITFENKKWDFGTMDQIPGLPNGFEV